MGAERNAVEGFGRRQDCCQNVYQHWLHLTDLKSLTFVASRHSLEELPHIVKKVHPVCCQGMLILSPAPPRLGHAKWIPCHVVTRVPQPFHALYDPKRVFRTSTIGMHTRNP
ncbi:hypothetical protein R1flu_003566 [Riccia fluitans]|uniref:Uncharacterized protein n=1 Tax=Riccia fluitans TaxID=41844 RepID=A0ABD1Y9D5_9MARC